LEKIFDWFSKNNLILNYSKCQLINFHIRKSLLKEINFLSISNNKIYFGSNYKYLGIILDEKLKFSSQYNKLFSLYGHYLSVFKFISRFTSCKHRGKIYVAFILPIIEYSSTAFIHFSSTKFSSLMKLNNYMLSFTNLDISKYSLNKRLLVNMSKIIFKIQRGFAPKIFCASHCNEHCFRTRINITLPIVNKAIFKHSFNFWYTKFLILFKSNNIIYDKHFLATLDSFFNSKIHFHSFLH
jgi:hypothetical protein